MSSLFLILQKSKGRKQSTLDNTRIFLPSEHDLHAVQLRKGQVALCSFKKRFSPQLPALVQLCKRQVIPISFGCATVQTNKQIDGAEESCALCSFIWSKSATQMCRFSTCTCVLRVFLHFSSQKSKHKTQAQVKSSNPEHVVSSWLILPNLFAMCSKRDILELALC